MNILLLNWRDPKNPKAGGAEKLNLQILKPFIDRGDSVTWYALASGQLSELDSVQGIKIIRKGNMLTHFIFLPIFFWTVKFGKVDFIIDSIHGTGYFSSLLAPRTRKVILICEVAKNIWDEMYFFPLNKLGKILERYMFLLYKRNKFWTISNSTKLDLIKFGIRKENIKVLSMGFDAPKITKKFPKMTLPTALFVGRLVEMKGIKDAISAVHIVNKNQRTKWLLQIIGRGEDAYERELKKLVESLDEKKNIKFLGFVSEEKKFEAMSRAWTLLVPSSREGWGMIVHEANFAGTQVIAYNSPGLVDSVKFNSKDNVLVNQDPDNIADELVKIIEPVNTQSKALPGWGKLHSEVLEDL